MKATELRVGNYVIENEYKNIDCVVESINDNGINIELENMGSAYHQYQEITQTNFEDLSPIPLTEQWLKDFDWVMESSLLSYIKFPRYKDGEKKSKGSDIGFNLEEMRFTIQHFEEGERLTYIEIGRVIKYVHEFQNTVADLLGVELEKIEWEHHMTVENGKVTSSEFKKKR